MPLLLVVVELGLEGIVLEGIFGRHLLRVGGAVRRIRLYELLYLLLELGLPLVDWHWFGVVRDLAWVCGDVALRGRVIGGRSVELVESVLLEDGKFEHFFLEVVLFILVVVSNLGEDVGLLLLALGDRT